jgi:hypothetical protein
MGRSITRLIVCAEETTKSQSKPYKKNCKNPKSKITPHTTIGLPTKKKHQTLEINHS